MQQCAICGQATTKSLTVFSSRIGTEGETHRISGKVFVCGRDRELVKEMSAEELEELFKQPSAQPASAPPAKERDESSGQAGMLPFEPSEPYRNGNDL